MGLRFRKSVTLCKGVRLNFGKKGVSLSMGGHGFRKSFHTSGRVTTTVGIPGTGLYWVDTKNPKKRTSRNNGHSSRLSNNRRIQANSAPVIAGAEMIRDRSLDRTIPAENVNHETVWLTDTPDEIQQHVDMGNTLNELDNMEFDPIVTLGEGNIDRQNEDDVDDNKSYLTEEYIRNLYVQCDESIDWGEIQAGTSAGELMMDETFWTECKRYSHLIMQGNIDAYLDVIEVFRPVDDILLYAGEFEFGTDARNYIETEFRVNPNDVIERGIDSPLFEFFVFSVSIRVARDLMALLPIKKVLLHVECDGRTIFSSIMDKGVFAKCDFNRESLQTIMKRIDYVSGIELHRVFEVDRKRIQQHGGTV